MKSARIGRTLVTILRGDITRQDTDGIVNAANERLIGGGGVDGAIHAAGGPSIMAECDIIRAEKGGCPTGTAVITTAGRLYAKNVIHTVGPIWNEESARECDELLCSAYLNSLRLGVYHGLRTIAFPSISTGIYGFPIRRAAPLVLSTVIAEIEANDPPLEEIRFVLFSESDHAVYVEAFDTIMSLREEVES